MSKKRNEEAEELNLVPIMNLVTILIPFLLMAAQFISLAVIDSTLPAIWPPQPTQQDDTDKPLNLSVLITDQGFTIAGAQAVLPNEGGDSGPTVPCLESGCPTPDSYNTKELTRLLGLVKDQYPDDQNVILVPESRIQYAVLVKTMDATRESPTTGVGDKPRELFPYVVIAGGVK